MQTQATSPKKYDEGAVIRIVRAGCYNMTNKDAYRYKIDEITIPGPDRFGSRVWQIIKRGTDTDTHGRYFVSIGHDPRTGKEYARCTCPFFSENGDCKHAEKCRQTIKGDQLKSIIAERAAAKVGAGRFDREIFAFAHPFNDRVF